MGSPSTVRQAHGKQTQNRQALVVAGEKAIEKKDSSLRSE